MKVTLTWDQYRQLESTVTDITLKLERAACVIQDLTENYFGRTVTRDDLWKLEAGFHEHRTKADIVFDYIADSQKLVDQAEKLLTGGDVL
ncbi:hypothetical protein [Acetobacterium malicum]|uniref:hypothetical protein n=1 Tax=Acetobacterium malicum TaxID=52692 RepID=UPI00040B3C66|nr:hypothetical protein [Acetobacterium dehalogenans]